MTDERSRALIEARELHAVGRVSEAALQQFIEAAAHAREEAKTPFRFDPNLDPDSPAAASAWAAAAASTNAGTAIHFVLKVRVCVTGNNMNAVRASEDAELCALVRDIFGNPFRPVAFDPAWRTDTALALARQMYDLREFGAMPILADALQEAGCEDEQVLAHCRDVNQVHVRGCWVVDGVFGLS